MSIIENYISNRYDAIEIENAIKNYCPNGFNSIAFQNFAEKILARKLSNPEKYLKSAAISEIKKGTFNGLPKHTLNIEDYEKLVKELPNIDSVFLFRLTKEALSKGVSFEEWKDLHLRMKKAKCAENTKIYKDTITNSNFGKKYGLDFERVIEETTQRHTLLDELYAPKNQCSQCSHQFTKEGWLYCNKAGTLSAAVPYPCKELNIKEEK